MDNAEYNNFTNETFNPNEAMDEYKNYKSSTEYLIREILQILVLLIGIISDGAIIYVLTRFNRLRKKVINIFILNIAISDCLFLVFCPSFSSLITYLDTLVFRMYIYCILDEFMMAFNTVTLVFLYLLIIDWCLAIWRPQASTKFRQHYKFLMVGIWIFCLAFSTMYTVLCVRGTFVLFSSAVFSLALAVFFLVIMVLHIIRAVRKCRGQDEKQPPFVLYFTTCFVGCYTLSFVGLILSSLFRPFSAFLELCMCLTYVSSVVNLIMLNIFCKDFQACFKQALKFSKYIDSINNFEEDSEAPTIRYQINSETVDEIEK